MDSENANSVPTIVTADPSPHAIEASTPTIVVTEPSRLIEVPESLPTSHPVAQPFCAANTLAEKENVPPHVTTTTSAPIKITVSNPMYVIHVALTSVTNRL